MLNDNEKAELADLRAREQAGTLSFQDDARLKELSARESSTNESGAQSPEEVAKTGTPTTSGDGESATSVNENMGGANGNAYDTAARAGSATTDAARTAAGGAAGGGNPDVRVTGFGDDTRQNDPHPSGLPVARNDRQNSATGFGGDPRFTQAGRLDKQAFIMFQAYDKGLDKLSFVMVDNLGHARELIAAMDANIEAGRAIRFIDGDDEYFIIPAQYAAAPKAFEFIDVRTDENAQDVPVPGDDAQAQTTTRPTTAQETEETRVNPPPDTQSEG